MDFDTFIQKFDDLTDDQVDDLVVEIGKRKAKKKAVKPAPPAKPADQKNPKSSDGEPDADDKKSTRKDSDGTLTGYCPTKEDNDMIEKARVSGKILPSGHFKDGFDGCVAHMTSQGKDAASAQALCAYIGRRAGEIPAKKQDETKKEPDPAPVVKVEDKKEDKVENMPTGKLTLTKTETGANFELEIPIFKLNEDDHEVAGVVYEPDVVDAQGDSANADEIRKAAHKFLEDSRTIGLMHKEAAGPRAKLVESYIVPDNMRYGNQVVKKGSWVIVVKVADQELWSMIKSGAITGFSMGGTARDGGPAKQ